jgi:ribonuclease T1
VKRTWALCGILVLSAVLGGCNKNKSQDAAANASGASATQAAVQPQEAASGAPAASGAVGAAGASSVVTPVARTKLPGEAAETLRLIKAGGPYPFGEDGVLFRNSAVMLPQHPRGYYHAYTVKTPGLADRGLRRIVCGGPRKQTADCYYTEDYYVTFKRIVD